jgi:hypothetical protein
MVPSLYLCICPLYLLRQKVRVFVVLLSHTFVTTKRPRFIPAIWYDKKTERKYVLCSIHLLQQKDNIKDRVFCRASVLYIFYDKNTIQKNVFYPIRLVRQKDRTR